MPETLLTAIIDDDQDLGVAVCELLEALDFPARHFASADAFIAAETWSPYGCIVTDLRMPGIGGIELKETLAFRNVDIPVIIMTSGMSPMHSARARACGVRAVITKPFSQHELLPLVQSALDETRARSGAPESHCR